MPGSRKQRPYEQLTEENTARRTDAALKAVAREKGQLPTIDDVLTWDEEQGYNPALSRFVIARFLDTLADKSSLDTPLQQRLGALGIRSAVVVDGQTFTASVDTPHPAGESMFFDTSHYLRSPVQRTTPASSAT